MKYKEQLDLDEWKHKRKEIIRRDGYKCCNCNKFATINQYNHGKQSHFWYSEKQTALKKKVTIFGMTFDSITNPDDVIITFADKLYCLQVHHKYYVVGKRPWEYPNEALICLCNWCHLEFHKKHDVPVFKNIDNELVQVEVEYCTRCEGTGNLPIYSHVEGGVCFACNGNRYFLK